MPRKAVVYTRESFDARLVRGDDGHRLWDGPVEQESGYGYTNDDGRKIAAHVLAWRLWRGRVRPGWVVRNVCGVRLCCNPDHLDCVTRRRALELGVAAGRVPLITDVAWTQGRVARRVREDEAGYDTATAGYESIDAGIEPNVATKGG